MPFVPGHVLFSPKRSVKLVQELGAEEMALFMMELRDLQSCYMKLLEEEPMSIIIQNGDGAGQTVEHIHAHLMPEMQLKKKLLRGETKKKLERREDMEMGLEAEWIRNNLRI